MDFNPTKIGSSLARTSKNACLSSAIDLAGYLAAGFPDQVKAIVYIESIAVVRNWSDFGANADMFRAFRSPKGEEMVLDGIFFIEKTLPRFVMRMLSEEEMAV